MAAVSRSSNPFFYPNALWKFWGVVSALYLVVTVSMLGIFFFVVRVVTGKRPLRWYTKWIHRWIHHAIVPSGIQFEVAGRENDRPEEPAVVISNHQSLMDIPAAFWGLGGDIRMVSKRELMWVPCMGWGMWAAEYIFINRGNAASRKAAVKSMADAVKRGISVWIAPEGTRSRHGGSLGEFRPGSFAMAIENRLPIQPYVVIDAFATLSRYEWIPRPGCRIRTQVLPRIYPRGDEDAVELMNRVRSEMQAVLVQAGVEQVVVPKV